MKKEDEEIDPGVVVLTFIMIIFFVIAGFLGVELISPYMNKLGWFFVFLTLGSGMAVLLWKYCKWVDAAATEPVSGSKENK